MVKKVLIVNYEPKRLSRLNELIVDLGYESMTAKNGVEALDVVEKFVPDLAIIDPMLPKLSGFEVAQKLTSEHPGLPIIMVTSVYKGNRYRTEAISKYGVKEYLEEPFEDETLQTLVKKYMELSEPSKKPKKKASARRRLEEILEETMSGRMPGGKTVSHKKKTSEGPILTSSDIFSDVIKDVEEAPGELGVVAEPEKADAKEAKETHKEEPVVEVSPKPVEQPETKPEPEPKPESDQGPEVKKQEVEIKSEIPEPGKTKVEAKSKKKGKKSEGVEYGSYVLLEKVATGGMAELFKAKRRGVQGFQKIVAIKRILSHLVDNEEFVTMFIDEAKLAAQLNHPNIAQIYDLGKIENSFYIAMEYVEGYDLRNVLKECKKRKIRIPEPLVLFIASKMLSALDYAHRKKGLDMKDLKIVHRDISPQNILISKGGDVKLVDFGIAKAATKASHTQAGALKGKLLYMSPEQAYGKPIDNRSDLFSLASVIYESITGKKCFLADSEISILEKVRKVQYTPIQEVNEDVSKGTELLIHQAFSKKIENRFQSAKEMESELHGLMESLPFAVNERVLAQFVNALYQGDMNTIDDISRRYTVNEEVEPEEVEVPTPKAEPEMVAAVTLDDLNEDVDANATIKMDSGTMIMPDLEDVEKHEEELIEQFGGGSGGNKTGLIVAIVVVVIILGVIGYFAMMRKPVSTQQVIRKPQTQTVTEPESPTPTVVQGETTTTPVAGQKAGGEGVSSPQTNASTTSSAVLGIDREKLVQQLLKKKLAEEEAKLKKQKKVKKSTPKPVKKTVVAKKKPVSTATAPVAVEVAKPEVKAVESKVADTGKTTAEEPAVGNKTAAAAKETTGITTTEPATVEPEAVVEKPVAEPVVKKPVETKPMPQPIIPKTKEGDLVPLIEGEVVFPTPVKTVRARISVIDRRRNLHGEVLVQGLIDESGNVVAGEVRVLQNSVKVRNNLGKAAIRAFSKWKFTPAMKDGVRVKVYFTHTFVF